MRRIRPRDARRDKAVQRSCIEVGTDWRRCGAGDGGCGVLLPLGQPTCPRCGRTSREDLAPLGLRRALVGHNMGEHGTVVAVLRDTSPSTACEPAG